MLLQVVTSGLPQLMMSTFTHLKRDSDQNSELYQEVWELLAKDNVCISSKSIGSTRYSTLTVHALSANVDTMYPLSMVDLIIRQAWKGATSSAESHHHAPGSKFVSCGLIGP